MSDYYDLYLALELRGDLPGEELDEVRRQLGLTAATRGAPLFPGTRESHAFPGADVTALVPSSLVDAPDAPWELTLRSCVHEDAIGEAMELAGWLVSQATSDGWCGYLGHTQDTAPRHLFRVDGKLTVAD